MSFKDLGLNEIVLSAIQPLGYETPTPIQKQSIPHILDGKDILGCAQTGTGKTAAFALPIVHKLSETPPKYKVHKKPIRALIISPTRELTSQIDTNLRDYCSQSGLRTTVIYGGVAQSRQVNALRRGVDILVATPGRLLDLCNQGFINLNTIEFLVLDEADTMLDMGFLPDIKKVIKQCPEERQTLFFSATMPSDIVKLTDSILKDPVRVQIDAVSSAAETVDQKIYSVRQSDKKDLLVYVIHELEVYNTLVFTRTKFGADKVERHLRNNNIKAEAIHGNKSQPKRERALDRFRKGKVQVLVATDIASRGIDVEELSLVINYELPNLAESYVHRIGRTGRAGKSGLAISFCNEGSERNHLKGIQKLIGKEIEIEENHPFSLELEPVGMDHKPSGKSMKKSRNKRRSDRRKTGARRSGGGERRRDGGGERRGYGGGSDERRRDGGAERRGYGGGSDERRRDGGGERHGYGGGGGERRRDAGGERSFSSSNKGNKRFGKGPSKNDGYRGSSFGPSSGGGSSFAKKKRPKFKGNTPSVGGKNTSGKKRSSFNKKRR
ncbi:MAG: DEAD/DEAH box helicase [Crocinitomicaceae bacterium]|nr:DEAD/DEAH box helicase [Crocinitomicaceae bacterium]